MENTEVGLFMATTPIKAPSQHASNQMLVEILELLEYEAAYAVEDLASLDLTRDIQDVGTGYDLAKGAQRPFSQDADNLDRFIFESTRRNILAMRDLDMSAMDNTIMGAMDSITMFVIKTTQKLYALYGQEKVEGMVREILCSLTHSKALQKAGIYPLSSYSEAGEMVSQYIWLPILTFLSLMPYATYRRRLYILSSTSPYPQIELRPVKAEKVSVQRAGAPAPQMPTPPPVRISHEKWR